MNNLKNNLIFILGLSLLLFSACEQKSASDKKSPRTRSTYKLKLGDNMEWGQKDVDTSTWENYIDVNGKGLFWFRIYSTFSERTNHMKDPGILIGATGSYEAYLDGVFLGKSGQLKTSDQPEIQGEYIRYFPVPDSLVYEGEHVLALRMTTDIKDIGLHAFYEIDEYQDLIREPFQISLNMFILAGAFLITAVYFLFIFIGQPKEYSFLLLMIICLAFTALLLMEYLKFFYSYPYGFQRTRLVIISYLHVFTAIMVPLFLMIQFSFPWKRIMIPIILLSCWYVGIKFDGSYDRAAYIHSILLWIFSGLVVAYAIHKKEKAAYIVMIAITANILVIYIIPKAHLLWVRNFDVTIFLGYLFLVISMLYVMTNKRKEERKAYQASLVLSERLKNELLRKNIKPHFIMNTLTSLIDWVEESPKEGVQFINALANEFEVLNEIADYQLIPVEQEIKLCKSHLTVMSYRKEIHYIWEQSGIDPNDIIPPAIIHTAVENGVTHSLPNDDGKIIFKLFFERTNKHKQYTLQTIAKNRTTSATERPKDVEGTGLKYIKSRLRESYQDQWDIDSHVNDKGWITKITIYKL